MSNDVQPAGVQSSVSFTFGYAEHVGFGTIMPTNITDQQILDFALALREISGVPDVQVQVSRIKSQHEDVDLGADPPAFTLELDA